MHRLYPIINQATATIGCNMGSSTAQVDLAFNESVFFRNSIEWEYLKEENVARVRQQG